MLNLFQLILQFFPRRYLGLYILTCFNCSIFLHYYFFFLNKNYNKNLQCRKPIWKVNIFDISFGDASCVDANYSLLWSLKITNNSWLSYHNLIHQSNTYSNRNKSNQTFCGQTPWFHQLNRAFNNRHNVRVPSQYTTDKPLFLFYVYIL